MSWLFVNFRLQVAPFKFEQSQQFKLKTQSRKQQLDYQFNRVRMGGKDSKRSAASINQAAITKAKEAKKAKKAPPIFTYVFDFSFSEDKGGRPQQ